MYLLTHVGTLTKKQGTSRQNPGPHPRTPKRTETEFFYKLGFSN